MQEGDAFSKTATISSPAGNEWNPAIAADSSGRVTVGLGFLSPRQLRRLSRALRPPGRGVKRSRSRLLGPVRSLSIGRLRSVGHAVGGLRRRRRALGQRHGAYETSGVPVYGGRAVRIRGFARMAARSSRAPRYRRRSPRPTRRSGDGFGLAKGSHDWKQIQPDDWKKRGPNLATARPPSAPGPAQHDAAPPRGRVGTAVARLPQQASVRLESSGYCITEFVTSYAGGEWTRAVYVHHSDNLLDNRPALVSTKAGELPVIHSSDGRRRYVADELHARRQDVARSRKPWSIRIKRSLMSRITLVRQRAAFPSRDQPRRGRAEMDPLR